MNKEFAKLLAGVVERVNDDTLNTGIFEWFDVRNCDRETVYSLVNAAAQFPWRNYDDLVMFEMKIGWELHAEMVKSKGYDD